MLVVFNKRLVGRALGGGLVLFSCYVNLLSLPSLVFLC